jgi:hypothetical protein
VKLILTEYGWLAPVDSCPVATCCPLVDKVLAVTAEVGTVAQLVKEPAPAWTFKFQVLPLEPPVVVQLTVDAELPETLPKSGSVAAKLIVLGAAETGVRLVAGPACNPPPFTARATTRDFPGRGATWAVLMPAPRHESNDAVNAMRMRIGAIVLPP